jgi:hypothetical protein
MAQYRSVQDRIQRAPHAPPLILQLSWGLYNDVNQIGIITYTLYSIAQPVNNVP